MEVIEANSTTALYERLKASKPVQALLYACNSMWFIAVPFLLALISNMFSLEIPVYIFVTLTVCFILLFNHDTKPVIPFFIAMYFGTSRKNSPILTDTGIYQTAWSLGLVIGLVAFAVVCFCIRMVVTGEYKNFRFRNMRMSTGLLAFGAALVLGGLFSAEMNWQNVLFGSLEFVAFAFIYLYFTVTIDWKNCGVKYIAYSMLAMGVLMCLELMWIYVTVDGVITGGVINKYIILTGWGIQNNIGGMMTLSLPFCYYLAVKEKHGWIYILLAECILTASLFTLSRTSIITGIGVAIAGSVLVCVFSKNKRIDLIVLGASLAAGLILFFVFIDKLGELLDSMIDLGLDLSGREELYVYGINQYISNPFFGVGYFMDPGFEVYDMIVPGRYHNMFIQILASCGSIGIAAYLFHFQQVVRVAIKKISKGRIFIAFGILTLMALSQMDNHFFNIGPGLIYSAMLCFLEGDLIKTQRLSDDMTPKERRATVLTPIPAEKTEPSAYHRVHTFIKKFKLNLIEA